MKLRDEIGDEEVDKLFNLLGSKDFKYTPKEEREFVEGLITQYKLILATL